MKKILESPHVYQASVIFTHGSLRSFRDRLSRELGERVAGRTLDVCCGTGNFASLIKGEYFGFDLNEKYIDYARRRFGGDRSKKFFVMDINAAEFKDDFFDNTLILSALHHFSDQETGRLLSKINNITKGMVIITDPAIESKGLISKMLISLDRGGYMRSEDSELMLISKHLDVVKKFKFYSGIACVRMIVCRPKSI